MGDDRQDTTTDIYQDTVVDQYAGRGVLEAQSADGWADTPHDTWIDTVASGWSPHAQTETVYLSPGNTALLSITPQRKLVKLC